MLRVSTFILKSKLLAEQQISTAFSLTPHNHETALLLEVYTSQGAQETALQRFTPFVC